MMNKEVYLKNVAESLALLSREVSILNAVNLYDINIVAEDFFPGLLNLIYGYELKKANYLEKNAPAIDLVDPKNRIAVQVTSNKGIIQALEEKLGAKLYICDEAQLCGALGAALFAYKKCKNEE